MNPPLALARRDQITAFRLEGHHLVNRLPAGSLLQAAGACSLQNTPPGSAALSLCARVDPLTPGEVEAALVKDKTLLQTWSLRASPTIFPTCDAAIFTLGLFPTDETALRFFIFGVEPALGKVGLEAAELVGLAAEALREELNGKTLTKDQLGLRLAGQIAPQLSAVQREAWERPSWYANGQTLGESMVRFALPVLALQGLCCHAERFGNKAYLRLTSEWLPAPLPSVDIELAKAELLRRYLHCYGPSNPQHFAEWAGISRGQARGTWRLVAPELAVVELNGMEVWLLVQDLPGLLSPPNLSGVRFLPPHDPYLQLRDRDTLVAGREIQRQVWRASGNPGVILVDGEFAGLWRAQKQARRLVVSVASFRLVGPELRRSMEAEAVRLLPFRDCTGLDFELTDFDNLS